MAHSTRPFRLKKTFRQEVVPGSGKLGNNMRKRAEGLRGRVLRLHEMLRKNGNIVGGEGLQSAQNAATLRFQNGKVSVTDGPCAETKEQLAGFFILEARDLNHAIQLMSKHPGVKAGPFEIRPAKDLTEMIRESERRRAAKQ